MAMLDRYRKAGGFLQLLNVLETCGAAKQAKFLQIIDSEDRAWGEALRAKMLTFEKVMSWSDDVLVEVFSRLKDITVATVRHGLEPSSWQRLGRAFPLGKMRSIDEIFAARKPNAGELTQAYMQVVSEVRDLVAAGQLRLDRIDAAMHVEDGIEEEIARSQRGVRVTGDLDIEIPATTKPEGESGIDQDSEKGGADMQRLRQVVTALDRQNRELKQEITDLRAKMERVKKIVA